jgi:hypothetical protein
MGNGYGSGPNGPIIAAFFPSFGFGTCPGEGFCFGVPGAPPPPPVTLLGCAIITDDAKKQLLNEVRRHVELWEVLLFSDLPTPTQEVTLADCTEADFPGYFRKFMLHVSHPGFDGHGHAVLYADAVMWVNNGTVPVMLKGWGYVSLIERTDLKATGLFAQPIVILPGKAFAFVPGVDLGSGCP